MISGEGGGGPGACLLVIGQRMKIRDPRSHTVPEPEWHHGRMSVNVRVADRSLLSGSGAESVVRDQCGAATQQYPLLFH